MADGTEPTPRAGTKTMPEDLPMRRLSDRIVCPHPQPTMKYVRPGLGGHWLLDYLVSSAAIAVLIVAFQVWQVLKQLTVETAKIAPIMQEQNKILNDIHQSIHIEAQRALDVDAARGKTK